jgi:hypothetical protein
MTTGARLTAEFGKRRQVSLPPDPGPKRSNHVALLVMGTLAVGGGAYALMPGTNCQPTPPGMAAAVTPQLNAGCVSRGSSGSGGYSGSWRYGFFGNSGSAAGSSETSGVTRGGFGSFARAFGFGGG